MDFVDFMEDSHSEPGLKRRFPLRKSQKPTTKLGIFWSHLNFSRHWQKTVWTPNFGYFVKNVDLFQPTDVH